MFSLILRAWPWLALIAIGLVLAVLSEVLDYFFPGHGWMIVAYTIGAFGIGFIGWALLRDM